MINEITVTDADREAANTITLDFASLLRAIRRAVPTMPPPETDVEDTSAGIARIIARAMRPERERAEKMEKILELVAEFGELQPPGSPAETFGVMARAALGEDAQ